MHTVFRTSTCTYTSMIPWIIAICLQPTTISNNSPCSVMTKLPYTALIFAMIVHLPYMLVHAMINSTYSRYTAIAVTHLQEHTLPYMNNDK